MSQLLLLKSVTVPDVVSLNRLMLWMAFIEWAWWPGRTTGDDKDCPARLKLINNRKLKIELGRVTLTEMSSPMARLGPWQGGAGRQINVFIVSIWISKE